MASSRSKAAEAQAKRTKVITAVVIGVLAVGLLAWQLPKLFEGPVLLPDTNLSEEAIKSREDLALLKALDRAQLEAEVLKRQHAMQQAQGTPGATEAIGAYARATDELTTRPK